MKNRPLQLLFKNLTIHFESYFVCLSLANRRQADLHHARQGYRYRSLHTPTSLGIVRHSDKRLHVLVCRKSFNIYLCTVPPSHVLIRVATKVRMQQVS